jgi:hypothetical protein
MSWQRDIYSLVRSARLIARRRNYFTRVNSHYKERCFQAKSTKTKARSFRDQEINNRRIVNTNQDVKLVLSAYRPNGVDARDAFFEEALEQAKRDPELMEWFVKQRVFDDVIVSKLRTIEPPAGLNLEILAGLRAIGEPRRAVGP